MKLGIAAGSGLGSGKKLSDYLDLFQDLLPSGGVIRTTQMFGENYDDTDELIASCYYRQIQVILTCGYNNGDVYGSDANDFTDFAIDVVNRYRTVVEAYEFGNEMNHLKVSAHPDPVKYTQMHINWYNACKAIEPNVTLLTSGLGGEVNKGGGISMYNFLQSCYQSGIKGYFDGLALHPYGYPLTPNQDIASGDRGWAAMLKARLLARSYNDAKPVYITEFGAPTFNLSEARQNSIIRGAMRRANAAEWIEKICIFSLIDSDKEGLPPDANDNDFGLMYHSERKKLSWTSVHNMAIKGDSDDS